MCGIAGFVAGHPGPVHALESRRSVERALERLRVMTDVLRHRGPNARGFFLQHWAVAPSKRPALPTLFVPVSAPSASPASATPALPASAQEPELFRRLEVLLRGQSEAIPTTYLEHAARRDQPVVGLGARRLAIVDVGGGQQPLHNELSTVFLVFNGEIYNYRELQSFLVGRGHRLSTGADSEVIVHLYEELGIDGTLERLDGMFAFALWDAEAQVLHLARDPLGEKPLYYLEHDGELRFASELKGLLVDRDIAREIDPEALIQFLFQEAIPAPLTPYRRIAKLMPGSRLSWSRGSISIHKYWRLPPTFASAFGNESRLESPHLARDMILSLPRLLESDKIPSDTLETLAELIARTVQSRLMGDVPVGVLLSGGLDSSIVAALARPWLSELRTFSIGFAERSFDETSHAASVARLLQTRHTCERFSAGQVPDLLESIQDSLDEPLADGSLLPTLALTRLARREGVVVALAGDGGDEVFGGYPTYQAHQIAGLIESARIGCRNSGHEKAVIDAHRLETLSKWLSQLPSSYQNISWDFKLRRFVEGLRSSPSLRHARWMAGLQPQEILEVLEPEWSRSVGGGSSSPALEGALQRWLERTLQESCDDSELSKRVSSDAGERRSGGAGDWLAVASEAQRQDLLTYLPNDLLVKTDRASMAVGLEVRAPLLAKEVVIAGLSLPAGLRATPCQTKRVLRRLAERWLPPEVVNRPKKGFGMPTALWLRSMPEGLVRGWLGLDGTPLEGHPFRPAVVDRWLTLHRSGRQDLRKRLWPIVMWELWRRGPWGPTG